MEEPIRIGAATEVPVLDEYEDTAPGTMLDELRADLAQEIADEPVTIAIPGRPGIELKFSTALDQHVLAKLRKASKDRSMPEGIDELGLACRILATQHAGLIRNGEEVLTEGEPLTVRTPALLDLVGASRPVEAVRALFGKDGHVLAAARRVLQGAGYDEDALEAGSDPTQGS